MRKQRYIVLALVLIALVQHSCQVIYFVLPQKYEEQIKTKQKIQKTAKLQKQQKKEEQAREEKLRKQWLEMQSDATIKSVVDSFFCGVG